MTSNIFIAEAEIHGVGHPDFPGGCSVGPAIWRYARTDIHGERIQKLLRRYNNLRRMGVARHNIHLAPLQDDSNK